MKFKTQYQKPANYGRQLRQIPCENFEPNQGKRVAQVISEFVQGIEPNTPNLNGYATPDLAQNSQQFVGSRSLPIDSAFGALTNSEIIKEIENDFEPSELAQIQREVLNS